VSTPVLHVLAGPNGSGKSTFVRAVLEPVTRLPFVNADEIAADRWPGDESAHAYEASAAAAEARADLLRQRRSFITETVFSHPSKVDLVRQGVGAGYLVTLHVVVVPLAVTLHRVAYRVAGGGHAVPPAKIRDRYDRLWPLVVQARDIADATVFYDNSRADRPFTVIASYDRGRLTRPPTWPRWTPPALHS
jgi:predicted ABC-type ATPase